MNISVKLEKSINNSYNVLIAKLQLLSFDKKVAIITNTTVAGFHIGYLSKFIEAKELYIITIPDGEEYKNFETINYIMNRLFDHRFNRESLLIAFGGGVVGDITGFVASIYQRGIDFIQIPTTLLSMVDSSVGGKTGINNNYGKNLIGSFWQPKAVYIDIFFLTTLAKKEFSAGVAEIIKMAVMFDKTFFEWLCNHRLDTEDNIKFAIKKSIEIKAEVVSLDERECGIRAVLNYGHTFAHVIENLTNYTGYIHGEAVAIGMVMANKLALSIGSITKDEFDKILNILKTYNLPTEFIVKDVEEFYRLFFLDKKSTDDKIKFILPDGIGAYTIKSDIPKEKVINIL